MENKTCPACGSSCPTLAPSCPRCHHQFVPTGAVVPARRTVSPWSILASAGFALILLFVGGLFLVRKWMTSQLEATSAYQYALKIAQASPEVQSVLGEPIKVSSTPFGFTLRRYGSQFAQWKVALSGSHASGDLYGVANELDGKWEYSRLTLIPSGKATKLDVTPQPPRLLLPPVPEKKVYLVPFDLDAGESLDWAPTYYKSKLGVDVSLLPAMHSNGTLIDISRGQLDSKKCLEYLRNNLRDIAADPSAILIAVTSQDIFIRTFSWVFAENYRLNGRFAVVSSARLRPPSFLAKRNPEWLTSRLQKLITKNIAILYFDLPMSSDYTSLLSGGVLSGGHVDLMCGAVIGSEGRWHPFLDQSAPNVTIYDVAAKAPLWRVAFSNEALPDTSAQVFGADLAIGLFIQRQADFLLNGKFPLQFVRVYRNQDEQSRSFGIGANDSLDIMLIGEMGSYVDLVMEDGARVHFEHSSETQGGDSYVAVTPGSDFSTAIYRGDTWTISRKDGWKFYMPYRPKALPQYVTVLTGFSDPAGHQYRMERNSFGELLSVTTPSGEWLHFRHDSVHRVQRIEASTGRSVSYDYNRAGCLSRVTDSEGHVLVYTYDDKAQMKTVSRGTDAPVLTNTYDLRGNIEAQVMADGEKFEYHYVQDFRSHSNSLVPDLIVAPNHLLTHIHYRAGSYTQSLPILPPTELK